MNDQPVQGCADVPVEIVGGQDVDQEIASQLQDDGKDGGEHGLSTKGGSVQADDEPINDDQEDAQFSVAEDKKLFVKAFGNNGISFDIGKPFCDSRG